MLRQVFPAALLLVAASVIPTQARPIEFSEVSLLVRAHEESPSILQEVRSRKLLHPLDASQEKILQAQGADENLIRSLRDTGLSLSSAESAAFAAEQARATKDRIARTYDTADSLGEQVRVFDVAYNHPVNLEQWGGPSGEIMFQLHRYAGEDIVEPIVTDSYTSTATYRGQGRPDDMTTIFDRRDYVSAISHEHSRSVSIDTQNPVSIKGCPYLLYPLCGAGRATLYYIGKFGGSVRLAIVMGKA